MSSSFAVETFDSEFLEVLLIVQLIHAFVLSFTRFLQNIHVNFSNFHNSVKVVVSRVRKEPANVAIVLFETMSSSTVQGQSKQQFRFFLQGLADACVGEFSANKSFLNQQWLNIMIMQFVKKSLLNTAC
ncbi:hypothetical protein D5086_032868 [Populus alba]|uniref:Uncharacterized protein n=1 Tax=Populus alba TaxID=43335 RepID=A0ACC4AF92_POPAL